MYFELLPKGREYCRTLLKRVIVVLLISICEMGFAAQIFVPGDFSSIQEAIDTCYNGDEIIVSPGTYPENINFNGMNIIVRSSDPLNSTIVQQTIIDGQDKGSVVTFTGTEPDTCILSGFTITKGGQVDYGGGIQGNGTNATIKNNHITKNGVFKEGGGLWRCHGTIEGNIISQNYSHSGGDGIESCNGLIINNVISDNDTIGCSTCNGTIKNNIISNQKSDGLFNCKGFIIGNKIYGNGNGISYCDGTIQDNAIYDNSSKGIYNCNAKIRDNAIYKNQEGIQDCDNSTFDNNTISQNTANGISYCYQTLIINNTIEGNQGCGIQSVSGTIKNNTIEGNQNRGISNGSGILEYNRIINNYTELNGAGIAVFDGLIKNNIISGNYAGDSGGGIYGCDNDIQNNIIENNSAFWEGGGISQCNGEIRGNIISHNVSFMGGGACRCNNILKNNVFYGNDAEFGGAFAGCQAIIQNCIIWNNLSNLGGNIYYSSDPDYSCIENWLNGGTGNISLDPLFIDPDNGDFHLQEGSPCIDAGNPNSLCNDACLPPGMGSERNDMGAYGGPVNCSWEVTFFAPALTDLTEYGDVWGAINTGAPPFETPTRWGWLGFRFDPENGWYPLKCDADASGIDDIIQITEYGDAWVAKFSETVYNPPTRWGWPGFKYQEASTKGWLPLSGDVDGTGSDDLIQVTQYGDAWVAISTETMYNPPTRWGWLGFEFSRGELGTPGAIPLAGDANGDGLCDLIQVTKYGDAWVALSTETMYDPPTRWGWPGFKYAPFDGWYPLCGDVNADGADDLIQITPTGDPWVSLSTESAYSAPTRWGWLNFYYDEAQGYYPLTGDVNSDGMIDLIQITPSGEALVAPSTGISFDSPEHWGWLGFKFDRDTGYLPFYLDY